MKIPRALRRPEDGQTSIIVASRRNAALYEVLGEKLRRVAGFTIRNPEYTDKPGHFRIRGRDGAARSGSVLETDENFIRQEFARKFQDILKLPAIHNADSIYVLAPAPMKRSVRSMFPYQMRRKIAGIAEGNFMREHPFEILRRISQMKPRSAIHEPMSDDARKILGIGEHPDDESVR